MNLTIPPDQLKDIVAAAVLNHLTGDVRDTLIRSALAHLMEPTAGTYSDRGKSPLQKAFNDAIERTARDAAFEHLKSNPDVMAKLDGLVSEAIARMTGEKREEYITHIAKNIANAISQRD